MSQNTQGKEQMIKDLEQLHKMIKPGDTVYTICRHISNSGMSRSISVVISNKVRYDVRDDIPDITYLVARVLGYKVDGRWGGIKTGGYGLDLGHQIVYELSRVMFKGGFGCIGEGCPSNDHSNGDRDYTPHMSESDRIGADGKLCECHKEHLHSDAGYALRQRWL